MSDTYPLQLIYQFGSDPDSEIPELTGRYQVLWFFSEAGFVPPEVASSTWYQQFPDADKKANQQLQFSSFDALKDFALSVCQQIGAPEVFLLSVQDYNIGVESARDVRAYREVFRRYGVSVPNPNIINRGPGFLGRFFNPGKR